MSLITRTTQQKIAATTSVPVNDTTTHVFGGSEKGGVGTGGVGIDRDGGHFGIEL